MENLETKRRIEELAKRAQQRRIARPFVKSDSDVKEENRYFEDLKFDLYKNIIGSGYE